MIQLTPLTEHPDASLAVVHQTDSWSQNSERPPDMMIRSVEEEEKARQRKASEGEGRQSTETLSTKTEQSPKYRGGGGMTNRAVVAAAAAAELEGP